MKVDHIGYAVKDMERAISKFEKLGFIKQSNYQDENRAISICFMENGAYRIELVSPKRKNSPVDEIIKTIGNSPYHICYQCTNLEETIIEMTKEKFRVVIAPEGAIAFGGRRVAFLFSLSVGLVELVERKMDC